MAAPNESRTPNWHRAKIAQRRVRMEGWRQGGLAERKKKNLLERVKKLLTRIGLLMEGGAMGPESPGTTLVAA